jgi:hypothetical protein
VETLTAVQSRQLKSLTCTDNPLVIEAPLVLLLDERSNSL